jgi:hypothetical protein
MTSNNNGQTWTEHSGILGMTSTYALAIRDTNLFAGTGKGIYWSTNYGDSWTYLTPNWSISVNALLFSGTQLFAGTYGKGVLLSADNGNTWTEVNNGLPSLNVISLAAIGTNLFAGTRDAGVFKSSNNGNSWISVNNGLNNIYISSLVAHGTNLFAASVTRSPNTGGVYLSQNNGDTWTPIHQGLTNTSVYKLAIGGDYLYASVGSLIWKRLLNQIVEVPEVPKPVLNISVYPNPAMDVLRIKCSTEGIGKTYEIVNVLGELVLKGTIVNHLNDLYIKNISNGIYFLRVEGTTTCLKFVKL